MKLTLRRSGCIYPAFIGLQSVSLTRRLTCSKESKISVRGGSSECVQSAILIKAASAYHAHVVDVRHYITSNALEGIAYSYQLALCLESANISFIVISTFLSKSSDWLTLKIDNMNGRSWSSSEYVSVCVILVKRLKSRNLRLLQKLKNIQKRMNWCTSHSSSNDI